MREGRTETGAISSPKYLGSLRVLATSTRADIAFAVNRLSAYTANPSIAHYPAVERALRYLQGTKHLGITYSAQDS